MDTFWGAFPPNSTVSGTSELFSSSVAMLGDSYQPYQEAWCEQQKAVLPVNFNPFFEQQAEAVPTSTHGTYMEHPAIYGNYDATASFPVYHAEQMTQAQLAARHQAAQQVATAAEEARQKEHYFAQKIADSGIAGMSPAPTVTISSNPHHTPDSGIGMVTPSRRPSSVCGSDVPGRSPITSSESGIENDGSPGGSEANPSDMEEGEGRVMCQACKGLYPSRRSLTGHIGRNEKCREIIDQVAAGAISSTTPDTNLRTSAAVSAMTNGQDGLSPICPHCDKFISHYKGNIRRHINTCDKNTNYKKSRPDKERERKRKRKPEVRPQPVLQEGFEPSSAFNPMLYNHPPQQHNYPPVRQEDRHMQHAQQMHIHAPLNVSLPADPSPPNPPKRDEPPDDAYICGLCDFVTIYKGNMKRHLNTCHKSNDCKDLKEWDRKLESMRASSLGMSREEMLQRLHLHRMNSTRGRKPGKRHLSHEAASHLVVQQHHSQPSMAHNMQSAPVHSTHAVGYQQQEQMVLPSHVPMTMMTQETEMFSMPQMQQVHYGYDMGAYLQ